MSTLLRRLVVSLAASAGLVFGLAGPAAATAPYIGTFAFDESGVDDGATAACGFTVSTTTVGTGRFQVFLDQSGNPVRIEVEDNVRGTFSANGLTVNSASHTVTSFDLAQGTETDLGLVDRHLWLQRHSPDRGWATGLRRRRQRHV